MIPIAYSDYSLGQPQSQPSSGSGAWLVILLVIVGIVVAVVLVAKIASPPANVSVAQLELKRVQAQIQLDQDRKLALKREIQGKLSLTKSKFHALEQECQAIESDFLSLCGVPLEQAHVTVSRKIADIGLESPKFISLYTQLLNSRVPKSSFTQQRNAIARVSNCLLIDSIADSHISTLDDVLTWIEQKHQVLQLQHSTLDQLRQLSL